MNSQKTGAFIKKERERLKMTQRELGERFSVTDKAVSKWERGLAYPDVEILKEMAALFGCSMQEILNGAMDGNEVLTSQSSFSAQQPAYAADNEIRESSKVCPDPHNPRRCLIIADQPSDFTRVLEACGAEIEMKTMREAADIDLAAYDVFCVLAGGLILSLIQSML